MTIPKFEENQGKDNQKYLALSGFLIISKNSQNDNQSKKTKRIGLFLFCLSTIISILSLFGLAE